MRHSLLRTTLILLGSATLAISAMAQNFPGSQLGQIGQTGLGQFGQQNSQIGGGFQGGTFGGGGLQGNLGFGKTIEITAFCNDLFVPRPEPKTRFVGATDGLVEFANGASMPLDKALKSGLVTLTGARSPAFFGPANRNRPLTLALTNRSGGPIRISVPAGASVIPAGQRAPKLHPRTAQLFQTARQQGIRKTRLVQMALWASTGKTRLDIEQTELRLVTAADAKIVKQLLKISGIGLEFERAQDEYDRLYTVALKKLGGSLRQLDGAGKLPNGKPVRVEGFRNDKGDAVVTLTPKGSSRGFYYGAKYVARSSTSGSVSLVNLKTGQPVAGRGGTLRITLQD